MKQLRTPFTLFALLIIQACSSSQPPVNPVVPVIANLDNPATMVPQNFIMRGEVVVGHEVRSFTPCGSNQQYWLDLPLEVTKQAQALSRSPYQALYGEMIGYLIPPSQTGFNADYMARFVVQQVNQLSADNNKRCQRPTLSKLDSSLAWVGHYFASATDQRGFGVTLDLNPDHSATTRYRYQNGERELVEQGYWQQLNSNQIQVVMTLHQRQYLVSERVFTRQGDQLHADKEKIGNKVYSISGGGITLFTDRQATKARVE